MKHGQTVHQNIATAKTEALSSKYMTGQNSNFWLLLNRTEESYFWR